MDNKDELNLSINQANSLKKITSMAGWKIVEDFLSKSEEKYDRQLKDDNNDDIADIKGCRKIIAFIKNFRDLIRFTEISAHEDEQELEKIKKGERK